MIDVEIAYATADQQVIVKVKVLPNSTIADAIEASGLLKQFPEIDLSKNKVGIFSHLADLNTRLQPNDRVEIYRPLVIDPKEARRLRAKKRKA